MDQELLDCLFANSYARVTTMRYLSVYHEQYHFPGLASAEDGIHMCLDFSFQKYSVFREAELYEDLLDS